MKTDLILKRSLFFSISKLTTNFNRLSNGFISLVRKSAFLVCIGLLGFNSWGQSIFTNPITGTNPNSSNPYTSGQTVASGITVSGIGRGTGISGVNANDRYNANGWNSGSLNANDYFEWVISPGCMEIDFISFVYTSQRSNSSIANFAFRSSRDNFVANIGTPDDDGTTISLSASTFQNITSPITFRLYAWGADQSSRSFSINDFTFNGSVSNASIASPTATASQTFCQGATVANLSATGTGLQWYSTSFGGSALSASTILSSGSFFVSQTIGGCESNQTLTAGVTTFGSSSTATTNRGLVFNLTSDIILQTFKVNSSGAGQITVTLTNTGSNTSFSRTTTVSLVSGSNTINVETWGVIPVGTGYRLLLSSNTNGLDLSRTDPFTFPLTFAFGSITGNVDNNGSDRYNFFYDWKIIQPRTSVSVTVQNTVTAGSIAANQTICSGGDPAVFTSTTNGTGSGSITYRWERNTNLTTPSWTTVPGQTSATYDVPNGLTVTTQFRRITISTSNSVACESAATNSVQVTVNPTPTTANAGADQTGSSTCGLTQVTLAGNSPSVGIGAWSIISGTGGTITTPSSATSSFSGIAGSTYTLRWTISNSPCTASTDDVVITFNVNPSAGILSGTQSLCSNETTTLASTVSGGAWSSGATGIATINSSSGVVSGVSAGTATMTYTVTGTGGCSNATATRTVTVTAAPSAGSLSGTQSLCSNETSTLSSTVSGGAWSSSATGIATINSSTGVVSGVSAGTATMTYTVTGTGGCSNATATSEVTVNQPTTSITIGGNTINDGDYLWGGNINTNGNVSGNWYVLNNGVYSVPNQVPQPNHEVFVINTSAGSCIFNDLTVPNAGSFSSENIYIGDNATVTFANGASISVKGNFVNNGNFNAGSGTVIMDGTTLQRIKGSSSSTFFNNLTIDNSNGVKIEKDVIIDGILSLTNGLVDLGSNHLTIGSSASISGTPGNSKMIVASGSGELRKRFPSGISNQLPFTFPVGTTAGGNEYTPVELDFNSGNFNSEAYVGVRVVDQRSSFMSNSIVNYVNRNWIVEPSGITSPNYDITLHYVQSDWIGDAGAEGNVLPIKYSTSSGTGMWYQPESAGFTNAESVGSGFGNSTANFLNWESVTSFSQFGGAEGNNQPLPVELVSFSGTCEGGNIHLTWKTASEFNSSHFDVEKSRDGENWQLLTLVPSAGSSNELLTYHTVDQNATDGNNYYRLRQVDIDGTEKFYDPINVSCTEVTPGYFTSFPNPSGTSFQVIVNNKELIGTCVLNIVDATGKVMEQREIVMNDGINMFVINQELTPGIYFMNVSNGTKSTSVLRHAVK
jgi:hypothetical protein